MRIAAGKNWRHSRNNARHELAILADRRSRIVGVNRSHFPISRCFINCYIFSHGAAAPLIRWNLMAGYCRSPSLN